MEDYGQRGYLREDFREFHISEPLREEVDFHYHTFHKIVIPLCGNTAYIIEGRHYSLHPMDIAVVGRGCVHKPETVESNERVLLYLSADYLRGKSNVNCDLEYLFRYTQEKGCFVLRLGSAQWMKIKKLISELEREYNGKDYGSQIMSDVLIQQTVLELTRMLLKKQTLNVATVYDEKTVKLLNYINENLTENITIDILADTVFLSKYHMMRKFKEETGYTIHSYINNKRLMLARQFIEEGMSLTDACFKCGFRDYSVFSKAFKKQFFVSPGKNKNAF